METFRAQVKAAIQKHATWPISDENLEQALDFFPHTWEDNTPKGAEEVAWTAGCLITSYNVA
jgi:hypothetical protein